MEYTAYILFSEKLQQYYTGSSSDLTQRLADHNSGLSKHTRNGRPWLLIYFKECADKTSAIKLENKIKKRSAKRYLQDLGVV